MAMNWQTVQLPLAAGLNQKADERALQPPGLLIAKDCQFDEIGGIQTRKPFAELGSDISGGGEISDARWVVSNGGELLLFTKDTLYSWSATLSAWVSKGTHLAVATEEQSVFASTVDQTEAERGELDGVILYAWTDPRHGVYAAAVDAETGAVVMAPTFTGADRFPRIVVLDTRFLLFLDTGDPEFICYSIDPANPDLNASPSVVVIASTDFGGEYYDACRIVGADAAAFVAVHATPGSYIVGKVTAALAVTTSTKGRTSSGPLAIACDPTGTSLQIVRNVTVSILGDLVTVSSLADTYINQAIGSVLAAAEHITAAYRSTQDSGVYRCYVYWYEVGVSSNWVSTGNTLGTAAVFNYNSGLGSRAFGHDGRVYVWLQFFGESTFYAGGSAYSYALQNTYFLVRDDGFLVAKAAAGKAGGNPVTGNLPSVTNISGNRYAFCGIERRIIKIGGGANRSDYGGRIPRDVVFEFDSNEARRCARIGQTLYIACGEGLLQYDGSQLTEVGFHVFPYTLTITQATTAAGLADGTYAAKMTWRWDNARGEVDRSSTATTGTLTVSGGPDAMRILWSTLTFTHKTDPAVAAEVWRTAVNPTADAAFYLTTNKDPTDTSNPNRYLENDLTSSSGDTFEDEYTDATLITGEVHPENGQLLECLAPPPAKFIVANADRLFLAGVAGDPDRVWYSRLRTDGEVASFHDALTVAVPREGGAITGLAFLNETLIVFRETAVYALPGDGYDNTGGGANYGPARIISAECGASNQESIALTPGGVIFKSSKGWYLLNRGWSLDYIGGPVSDYDDEEVLAVHVVETQHQVRCLTASRMLVLDYLVNQWAEWTVSDGLHATIWQGSHAYLTSTGPKVAQSTYSGIDYGMDVETAWIKLNDLQGAGRVRRILMLGEYRGAHRVQIRVAFDYSDSYTDDTTWTVSPTTVGGPEQVKHGPSRQQCQAIKVRITVLDNDGTPPLYSEALKLTGLGLEVGARPGLHRRVPVAQKAGS